MGEPAGPGGGGAGGAGARPGPERLPGGRHGLQPSFVAANQRERMLSAVAQATAELGYPDASVEAIIARAGVSRRTFYQHFKNKEAAFLAAYDDVVDQITRRVQHAYLQQATALERLRAGLAAYLQYLAGEPEIARMGVVEILAAGPAALARRTAALRLFASIIEDNIRQLVPSISRPALTAETIVGGIYEVVFSRIIAGRTGDLPGMTDDLLTAVLMLDVDPPELSSGS